MNTEFLFAHGINFVSKKTLPKEVQPNVLEKAYLFQRCIKIIDSFYDSEKDPEKRQHRQHQALEILESGIIPAELDSFKTELKSFIKEYGSLPGRVKNLFEDIIKRLFSVTDQLRLISDPRDYANLTKKEANITATLMYLFLSKDTNLGSEFHLKLQTAARIYNQVDNSIDLWKDHHEGVTQVPPTLANALIILLS